MNPKTTVNQTCTRPERFFFDEAQWRLLREAAAEAWPDHPHRRLSVKGPSREQYAAFRRMHVEDDDDLAEIAEKFEELCVEIATACAGASARAKRGSGTRAASPATPYAISITRTPTLAMIVLLLFSDSRGSTFFCMSPSDTHVGFRLIGLKTRANVVAYVDIGDID